MGWGPGCALQGGAGAGGVGMGWGWGGVGVGCVSPPVRCGVIPPLSLPKRLLLRLTPLVPLIILLLILIGNKTITNYKTILLI